MSTELAKETVKKVKLTAKNLPNSFNECKAQDLIFLLVEMFNKLIQHNDTIPTTLANTTRFHSRSAPNISIKDYIESKLFYLLHSGIGNRMEILWVHVPRLFLAVSFLSKPILHINPTILILVSNLTFIIGINKYVIVEKSVLLMILVYVDRMCALYPTFTINSLTSHRYAERLLLYCLIFIDS